MRYVFFQKGPEILLEKIRSFKAGGLRALLEEIPTALIVPVVIKNTGKIDNSGKFIKNIGVKVTYTVLPTREIKTDQLEEGLSEIRKEMITIL